MKIPRRYAPTLWLMLILAVVAVVRIRLLALPLERDEGEYAYAGQLILEEVPPYRLIYNMKMPGIYAAYALIMAVFGQSAEGIHLGFMLVNFGAILLMYFVGRRFLDQAGAVAASAAYALLSLSPRMQGFNAHATHFVVLAALAAILVLLRARERGRMVGFFWSGALFGVAFLMKQPGGAFAFFGAALIAWTAWRGQPKEWKTAGLRLAFYATGVAAPIVLTGLILWRAGVWDKFWWWTVTYAGTHATALSWAAGKANLASFFGLLSWDGLFWGLALVGLVLLLTGKGCADDKFFFVALLFFSATAVCPTFHFTNHYFVLMLPVVALLSAKVFTAASARLAALPRARVRAMPWILFGIVCLGVAWPYRNAFFLLRPGEVADRLYVKNNFQVYPVLGNFLKSHAAPAASLAVLGSEPELLFYAHRRSVTGYIYMYDLVQDQPFRQRMEKEMISEVEQGQPDYLIVVNNVNSWLPDPPECFNGIKQWMMNYTETLYDPYGVVTSQPNQYFWGPHCFDQAPLNHRFVMIFQRKQSAPAKQD